MVSDRDLRPDGGEDDAGEWNTQQRIQN